jgi:hypothetical protein
MNDKIKAIADQADMIVSGYAFTKKNDIIQVVNINKQDHVMLINNDGKMLESSMDSIEQAIVKKIWENDSEFMEEENA